jgi:hypothetical protein
MYRFAFIGIFDISHLHFSERKHHKISNKKNKRQITAKR